MSETVPRETFDRLVDLHDALVLTAEYNPTATVASFVASAREYALATKFLHQSQHETWATPSNEPTPGDPQ